MNLIVLQRLFDNAVSAYRNGNKHELDSFSDYIIRNPHARDDLMQSVKARWSDSAARGGAAGPGAVDADAFSTLLGIDSLWCDAASLFLSCLGEGCMSGRSVVLCIGQLSSKMHSICTATLDQAQLAEAIRFLCTVPDCCLSAILDDSCERSPDQSGLELIAPCMDALAVLCRRRQAAAFKEANPVGQAVGAMLDRSWGHHVSALIHVMCDIHAHLGARHRDILKVRRCKSVWTVSSCRYALVSAE